MKWLTADGQKWLGYTVWFLLVTVLALFVRMPSEVAAGFLQRAFARQMPGYRLTVAQVAVTPLLRLRAAGCRVAPVGESQPVLQLEKLWVAPSLWGLCMGRKEVSFTANAYGGEVRGHVALRADGAFPQTLSMQMTEIQLRRYANLKNLLGRYVEGEVSGDVTYTAGSARFNDGTGQMDLTLRNGEVELLQPVLGFSSLDLGQVSLALEIAKGKATVQRFDLAGREGQGTITGSVHIQDNLLRSVLSLRGDIEPDRNAFRGTPEGESAMKVMQQFLRNGKIRIGVGGTFKQPKIRLL